MKFLFAFLLLLSVVSKSETTLTCNFENTTEKNVALFLLNDFINQNYVFYEEKEIVNGKVQFSIKDIQAIQPVYIYLSSVKIKLYLLPDKDNAFEIPVLENPETANFYNPLEIYPVVSSSVENINYQIRATELEFENFTSSHLEYFIKPHSLKPFVSSFDSTLKTIFLKDKHPFVAVYSNYKISELYDLSEKKITDKYKLLKEQPIQWNNPEYFKYIKNSFPNYLKVLSASNEKITESINVFYNWEQLINQMKNSEAVFKNDTLAIVVALQQLYTWYYEKNNNKQSVKYLLLSLQKVNQHPQLLKAAKNLYDEITWFEKQNIFKQFIENAKNKNKFKISNTESKTWYVGFVNTDTREFLADIAILEKLNNLYGKKVNFLIVVMSGNSEEILKERNLSNNVMYFLNDRNVAHQFKIKTLPVYGLFDNELNELEFPGRSPSEGLEEKLKWLMKQK